MNHDWLLWQLLDSAFPSGAFPHSGGLEAAYQVGMISSAQGFSEFLDAQLRAAVYASAPFVTAAHRDPAGWSRVDEACDLFLNNHVANRASRAQGGAFLAATERVFRMDRIIQMRGAVRAQRLATHFAPVLGACFAALGIGEARACEALLFITARGAVSSAVRLGIVGPLEGQSIQHAAGDRIAHWATRAEALTLDDAAQTAPVLDLMQATQDRLYSRLFQS